MTSTRRVGGGQAPVDACGRGAGGPDPCGRPHRKLKLESTDVILPTSHAKGRGVKNVIFCGRHKWMAPNLIKKHLRTTMLDERLSSLAVLSMHSERVLKRA